MITFIRTTLIVSLLAISTHAASHDFVTHQESLNSRLPAIKEAAKKFDSYKVGLPTGDLTPAQENMLASLGQGIGKMQYKYTAENQVAIWRLKQSIQELTQVHDVAIRHSNDFQQTNEFWNAEERRLAELILQQQYLLFHHQLTNYSLIAQWYGDQAAEVIADAAQYAPHLK